MNALRCEHVASFPIPEDPDGRVTCVGTVRGNLATGHFSGPINVWSRSGEREAVLLGHSSPVRCIAETAFGDVMSASSDDLVRVWRDETCVLTLTGHTDTVWSVASHPAHPSTFASGSWDETAKVWDITSGECVATLAGHDDWVMAVCVMSSGNVVTGCDDTSVRIWDAVTWGCTQVFRMALSVRHLLAVGDGFAVCAGDSSHGSPAGLVGVWTASGGLSEPVPFPDFGETLHHCAPYDALCVGGDGHCCIVQDGAIATTFGASRAVVVAGGGVATVKATTATMWALFHAARLEVIHVMVAVWRRYNGVPPPVADGCAVGRALCLRRFCRPRDLTTEVVEPFAREVIGFL